MCKTSVLVDMTAFSGKHIISIFGLALHFLFPAISIFNCLQHRLLYGFVGDCIFIFGETQKRVQQIFVQEN
jgi:hypothetical protein